MYIQSTVEAMFGNSSGWPSASELGGRDLVEEVRAGRLGGGRSPMTVVPRVRRSPSPWRRSPTNTCGFIALPLAASYTSRRRKRRPGALDIPSPPPPAFFDRPPAHGDRVRLHQRKCGLRHAPKGVDHVISHSLGHVWQADVADRREDSQTRRGSAQGSD
jgi:hypothetical protein